MRKKESFILLLLIIGFGVACLSCQTSAPDEGKYIPGGRNIEAFKYAHSDSYPPFPDKAHFIGTLRGDWYQMGKQFGEGAGESTVYVSDIWWKAECDLWGRTCDAKIAILTGENPGSRITARADKIKVFRVD